MVCGSSKFVSFFGISFCVFKAYAMKNAPQFGGFFRFLLLLFSFLSGHLLPPPPRGHFEHVAPAKFIKYNDTQHLFRWPMLKPADS